LVLKTATVAVFNPSGKSKDLLALDAESKIQDFQIWVCFLEAQKSLPIWNTANMKGQYDDRQACRKAADFLTK
jgi:hypothetical protein